LTILCSIEAATFFHVAAFLNDDNDDDEEVNAAY